MRAKAREVDRGRLSDKRAFDAELREALAERSMASAAAPPDQPRLRQRPGIKGPGISGDIAATAATEAATRGTAALASGGHGLDKCSGRSDLESCLGEGSNTAGSLTDFAAARADDVSPQPSGDRGRDLCEPEGSRDRARMGAVAAVASAAATSVKSGTNATLGTHSSLASPSSGGAAPNSSMESPVTKVESMPRLVVHQPDGHLLAHQQRQQQLHSHYVRTRRRQQVHPHNGQHQHLCRGNATDSGSPVPTIVSVAATACPTDADIPSFQREVSGAAAEAVLGQRRENAAGGLQACDGTNSLLVNLGDFATIPTGLLSPGDALEVKSVDGASEAGNALMLLDIESGLDVSDNDSLPSMRRAVSIKSTPVSGQTSLQASDSYSNCQSVACDYSDIASDGTLQTPVSNDVGTVMSRGTNGSSSSSISKSLARKLALLGPRKVGRAPLPATTGGQQPGKKQSWLRGAAAAAARAVPRAGMATSSTVASGTAAEASGAAAPVASPSDSVAALPDSEGDDGDSGTAANSTV